MATSSIPHACSVSLLILLTACGGGSGGTPAHQAPSQHQVSASPGTPPSDPLGNEASAPSAATPANPSTHTSPGTSTATAPKPGTQGQRTPLSADGFSGGVLATMLVQNTYLTQPDQGRPHPIYSLYGAVAWDAKAQKPISPANAPNAFGYQYLSTEAQPPIQPAAFHSASFITNFDDHPAFGRFTDLRTQLSLKPELERDPNPASLFLFTDAAIEAVLQRNASILELGKAADVMAQVRASSEHDTNDLPLRQTYTLSSPSAPLVLKNNDMFKFGHVLRQWRQGTGQVLQLIVLRGQQAGQIRLCLNYQLPEARRLHCSLWRLPKGWQFGRPLTYEGIHLQDDRSVHPGGKGKADWQTPARR